MRLFLYSILAIILNQSVVAQIRSTASGSWSSTSTWEGGVIPSATDNVIISNGHTVQLDVAISGTETIVCAGLEVEINGVLQLGYNGSDLKKRYTITGDLKCDGTISSGRNVPADGSSGEGLIYDQNSTLVMKLQQDSTSLTGKGYLHPKNLNIKNESVSRELAIDLYNIVLDGDFLVFGYAPVHVVLKKYTYLNIKGTFGATGGRYASAPANTQSTIDIAGIVYAGDVGLFTKNTTDGTSINLENEGVLTALSINSGNTVTSAAGGFLLSLADQSIFRCGQNVTSPESMANADPNLTVTNQGQIKLHYSQTLTSASDISNKINAVDTSDVSVKKPIRDKIGATHIGGWYNFTDQPFLLEGKDRFKEWGSRNIKTTISADNGKMYNAYPFNYNWPSFTAPVDVVKHPLMDSLFSDPYFTTHAFWAAGKGVNGFYKDGADRNHDRFLAVEDQIYDAAYEILSKYGAMGKTFIFQNWEGDWMLRGNNKQWEDDTTTIPDDVFWEIEGMSRMWRATMRGIERAVAEFPNATSKIQYAVEFNKLYDKEAGTRKTLIDLNIPCVVADVLPRVRMHLSSWSAYDGNFVETARPFPTALWNGMEIAAYFTNSTKNIQGIPVQLGEYANNENTPFQSISDAKIIERYDQIVRMISVLGVQNVYMWNLYCSGAQSVDLQKGVQYSQDYLYQVLDGKWVIEPDNTLGLAANFLRDQYFVGKNQNPIIIQHIDELNLTSGFTGEVLDLSQVFRDPGGNPLTYTATSSDESVVTVAVTGSDLVFSEKGLGSAVITVTASNDSDGSATISFSVNIITGSVFSGAVQYNSISDALQAVGDGDTIEIRGIHTESINISKSVTILGQDPMADKIQAASSLANSTSGIIYISRPAGSTADLNVTIANIGLRFGNSTENGGAIFADKMQGLLTLKNLIVEHNSSGKNGGAISVAGSNAEIVDCMITNNTSVMDGGAIILAPNNSSDTDCEIKISRSLIDSNQGRNGGGVYINGNKTYGDSHFIKVTLENTTLSNNSAVSPSDGNGGGAIWSKCVLWTGDNSTPNVSLELVHVTMYNNTHTSTAKNGVQFTSDPSSALTSLSIYNSLIVSAEDLTQNAFNFANANTVDIVNTILGSVNSPPSTILDDVTKNNLKGQTPVSAGLSTTLSGDIGQMKVLDLTSDSEALNYCTAPVSISLPVVDARGALRDDMPDAGAVEGAYSVSGLMTITEDLKVGNIKVSDQGQLTIKSGATLTVMQSIVSTGKVTVESGGALIVMGSADGNLTISRTTTGNGGYSIVGSPVTGANLSDLSADYLYDYKESTKEWITPTGAMQPGKGYFAGYDASAPEVILSGGIVSGEQSVAVSKDGDGFNLVANPYAGAISIKRFLRQTSNSNVTTGAVYLWDDGGANNGSQRGGDFIVVNELGAAINTNSLNDQINGQKGLTGVKSGVITSVQGFFIEATAKGNVTFTPDMQDNTNAINSDTNFYRLKKDTPQILKLSLSGQNFRKEALVGFSDGATRDWDYGYDARAMICETSNSFYSLMNDDQLSIQGLPRVTSDSSELGLGMYLTASGSYTLSVTEISGFQSDMAIFLRDRMLSKQYELDSTFSLTFQSDGQYVNDRFTVVFNSSLITSTPKASVFRVYGKSPDLTVEYASDQSEVVSVYSITGQLLYNKTVKFNKGITQIEAPLHSNQVYILQIRDQAIRFLLN